MPQQRVLDDQTSSTGNARPPSGEVETPVGLSWRSPRAWWLLVGVVIVAACGQALLFRADATVLRAEGVRFDFIPPIQDIKQIWHAAHALVTGAGAYPWYGDGQLLGYAPQYTVMFAPLGLVPLGAAAVVAVLSSALLVAAVVIGWSRSETGVVPWWAPALLLSYPAVNLVRLGQAQTALGLAALSLAVLAQRRGRPWLVGLALAIGLIRTPNALPLLGMLAVAYIPRPRQAFVVVGVMLAVLVSLTLIAQSWDHSWFVDWRHNLDVDQQVGLQRALKNAFGFEGVIGLELGGLAAGAAVGWRSRGGPVDLDRAALCLALSVLLTHLSGPYTACFILPAICRVALRPGLSMVAVVISVAPWLMVLASFSALSGPNPLGAVNVFTIIVPVMLVAIYPLTRSPRRAAAAPG